MESLELVERLAGAEIGATYNQYAAARHLRERLARYLDSRAHATVVLVGEAPGYRGARVSGIPFTSERQLTGAGPAEATATIVHRVLARLGVQDEVLLWNVVPTHPGTTTSNRRPTRAEVEASAPFLQELTRDRIPIAVGRLAAAALDAPYIRHPSHGGAAEFEQGLGWLSLQSAAGGPLSAAFYEDVQRQAGRDHARVVPRRRRGQDARPSRDPDRRHSSRQA